MAKVAIYKKIHSSKIFSDFMHNVVGAPNNGRSMLLLMGGGKCDNIPTVIRCDNKEDINKGHIAKGKYYPEWTAVLDNVCAKKETVYFTLNSFFGNNRSIAGLHSLQNLWVDVDDHSGANVTVARAKNCVKIIVRRLRRDRMPIPYAVFSGRGLHLFWPIIHCSKEQIGTWNQVQRELQEYVSGILEDEYSTANWTVDARAIDAARIIRMPGTFNRDAMKWSRFIKTSYSKQTSLDVFEDFFQVRDAQDTDRHKSNSSNNADKIWAKRLAKNRVLALMHFAESRAMKIEGCRNSFTTILCSCLLCAEEDSQRILLDFCRKLSPPQKDNEILNTFRCCLRKSYCWTNETIISRLGMNWQEAKRFERDTQTTSTIRELRKKRKNKTRDEERAVRKEKKERLYSRMPFLMAQGLTYVEIAKKLGVSLSTVKRHAKELLVKCKNRRVIQYRLRNILKTMNSKIGRFEGNCTAQHQSGNKPQKGPSLFFTRPVSKWCVYKYSLRQWDGLCLRGLSVSTGILFLLHCMFDMEVWASPANQLKDS